MDEKKKHGGARKGAGKPKGSVNKRTIALREQTAQLIASGIKPLEVMFDNMHFWHETSKVLAEKIMQLGKGLSNEDERAEFLKLLQKFLNARQQAQACAVDAAPYVHPKLASIALQGNLDATVRHVVKGMTAAEAAAAWAETLKAGKAP